MLRTIARGIYKNTYTADECDVVVLALFVHKFYFKCVSLQALKCNFFLFAHFKSYHVCQLFFTHLFLYFFFFSFHYSHDRSIERDSSKDSHLSSTRDAAVTTPARQPKPTTSSSRKCSLEQKTIFNFKLSNSLSAMCFFLLFIRLFTIYIFNNFIMNFAVRWREKKYKCIW